MKECLFTKYVRDSVDNNFEGPDISYGTLLRKCTCENCMEDKKSNRDFNERKNQRRELNG